jgi:hypothetical protein
MRMLVALLARTQQATRVQHGKCELAVWLSPASSAIH